MESPRPEGVRLQDVVPFGRGLAEYQRMFLLTEADLARRVLDVAAGPAGFTADVIARGANATAADPIYLYSRADLERRIHETLDLVIEKTRAAHDAYLWIEVRDPDELRERRLAAMQRFLADYDAGLAAGRYVTASLPLLPFANDTFDLALCSHFLFSYSEHCDRDFHIASVREMLRVAREVRIFPLVQIHGEPSPHVAPVVQAAQQRGATVERVATEYRMQPAATEFLRILRHIP